MSSLENEIKKTKEQIDNEINNVNILKEEIDFLKIIILIIIIIELRQVILILFLEVLLLKG